MNINEFKRRRETLLNLVGKNNVAVVYSSSGQTRNSDVEFPFRQDSSFYYLTGFNEPNSVAIFLPGRRLGEFVLFCKEFDKIKAIWEGAMVGVDGAVDNYGADEAYSIDYLEEILPDLLAGRTQIEPDVLINGMRRIKSEYEVSLMRKAAEVSCRAHERAMRATKPGVYEYQVESEIIHEGYQHGLRSMAYPSIVAGGNNACVLHYVENKDVLKDGDLLLIDAGVECDHYASDISRTFPVSGKFSQAQKDLYQLVLDSQLATIELVKPGTPWIDLHNKSVEVIVKGLVELGILKGEVSQLIDDGAHREFYMHGVGHLIGMDVHDVGERGDLLVGMALTVEPGIYIPSDCESVEEKYRGIGIRIEDDIVVTEEGNEVLTHSLVKEIGDIEKLMEGE
jgi:Xaa-Pro aminopeptidase